MFGAKVGIVEGLATLVLNLEIHCFDLNAKLQGHEQSWSTILLEGLK